MPGSRRQGRRFAHRSSPWRISRIVSQSATWSGTDGIAHRPEQHRVVATQGLERVLRHHPAVLARARRSPTGSSVHDDRQSERVDGLPRLGDHFRADAVARKDRDPVRHAGAARPGDALDVRDAPPRAGRRPRTSPGCRRGSPRAEPAPGRRRTPAGRASGTRTGGGRWPSRECSRSSSPRRGSPSRCPG